MKKIITLLVLVLAVATATDIVHAESGDQDFGETGVVYMNGEFLDGDLVKISVQAKELLDPILGISFHLLFDAEKLSFLKYEPGEFLELGGDPFYLVKPLDDGKVVFGETLRKNDDFPTSGGKIVDLYFQIIEESDFQFRFTNGVISTLDVVRQDLGNVDWENFVLSRDSIGSANIIGFMDSQNLAGKKLGFLSLRSLPLILAILAMPASIFLIWLLKKQGKKRHSSSVNFK